MTAQLLPDFAKLPLRPESIERVRQAAEHPQVVSTDDTKPDQSQPVIDAPAGVWGY